MVFHIGVSRKAQVLVDVLPVVEPVVAGVHPLHRVALGAEVPGVGVGVAPEGAQRAAAGEEAPLGVHRAPGENIGHQGAGHPFGFQRVPGGIDVGGELGHPKPGEVVIGLQHDAHHVDLLALRDVGVGIAAQKLRGLLRPAARGGRIHGGGDAVEKGIEKAPGQILLGGGPAVDQPFIIGGVDVIDHIVQAYRRGQSGSCGRQQDSRGPAPAPPVQPAPYQEVDQQPAPRHGEDDEPELPVQKQAVFARHIPHLLEQQQVAEHEGVVPEHQLVVVARGEAQQDPGGEAEGGPRPAGERVEEQDHDHRWQEVQKEDPGTFQISQRQAQAVRARGQQQGIKADPHARQRHDPDVPRPEGRPAPPGGAGLRPGLEQKRTARQNRIFS